MSAVSQPLVVKPDRLRHIAAQEMPARDKQIGEGAGDDETMSILSEPPIAHLGETKHSLDDADGMLDFRAHLRFGPVFRPLDLVISVDTAVAHLAGGLGKPVWLLNHFDTDWRWLLDRDDSPWYPSLRQFRQPTPGDWPSVISRVRGALQQLAGGDRSQLRPPMLTN